MSLLTQDVPQPSGLGAGGGQLRVQQVWQVSASCIAGLPWLCQAFQAERQRSAQGNTGVRSARIHATAKYCCMKRHRIGRH